MNLESMIGFGVAGNFANHLEQAREIEDFKNIKVDDENAPKGMFPFYLPKSDSFLGTYPLSSFELKMPKLQEGDNLQLEPEVAIICDIIYDNNNKVTDVKPKFFTAYNDCSIRKPDAKKISEKKNWSESSKGIGKEFVEIDNFSNGGILDDYNIASFLKRDNVIHAYGEDSPVLGYSYLYENLIAWIVDKLNNQVDEGPLENLAEILKANEYPKEAIISIGATAYTDFGESTFLEHNDEIFVVLYDNRRYHKDSLINLIRDGSYANLDGMVGLSQIITDNSEFENQEVPKDEKEEEQED